MYYEAHITLEEPTENTGFIELHAALIDWKYSKIDGDPVLGKKTFHYLTKHFPKNTDNKTVGLEEREIIQNYIEKISADTKEKGFNVIRHKLELVVYDVRYNQKKAV